MSERAWENALGTSHAPHDYRCPFCLQHNEPAGDQDVWHLHMHVLPRYQGDRLYLRHLDAAYAPAADRAPYAERLRRSLSLPTT